MSIWEYQDAHWHPQLDNRDGGMCIFCATATEIVKEDRGRPDPSRSVTSRFSYPASVAVCQACGWWKVIVATAELVWGELVDTYESRGATLCQFDLTNLSAPIAEVREYLIARYESRLTMHPRLLEETVASVFRSHGYKASVTGYANDGGIDVILEKESERIGVQVKRSKNTIQVEQIRSLAGALLLNRLTKGIFVTTSDFTKGAPGLIQEYSDIGLPIELINASRFYDALGVSQRPRYRSLEELKQTQAWKQLVKSVRHDRSWLDHP